MMPCGAAPAPAAVDAARGRRLVRGSEMRPGWLSRLDRRLGQGGEGRGGEERREAAGLQ